MIQFFPSRAVALVLGPVSVHWYGIMYMLGFLLGLRMLPRLMKYRKLELTALQRESLFLSVFLGVLLGGRLGFVLFYGDGYYLQHPLEIIAVWNGGMSSHGGFLGVAIALLLFSRRSRIDLLALTDVLVVPIAIGLALGRLGNLINGELYGTIASVPWAMHVPGVEGLRHPTQIYAILKDLFIALLCFLHLRSSPPAPLLPQERGETSSGRTTALFLILYAVLRFIVEIFRDQPYGYTSVFGMMLSRGQILTVPLFAVGVGIWCNARRTISRSSHGT